VKAPFSCPNNSEAISSRGIAEQFTPTNARELRSDRRWIARATSSFTRSRFASYEDRRITRCDFGDAQENTFQRREMFQTISSNIEALSISSRRATFFLTKPVFRLLAVLNIGASNIPTRNLSAVVAYRVVTGQKPTITSIILA